MTPGDLIGPSPSRDWRWKSQNKTRK